MRNHYKLIFKKYCHDRIPSTRTTMKLTQAKMANILCMDTRSYAELEAGGSACGGLTLALFLIYCCPSPQDFLDDLKIFFEKANDVA